jgi:hypothetical protein
MPQSVLFQEGETLMECKVCIQLEEAVAASVRLDEPSILLGLSGSGIRNRARQKEERQLKAKVDLERHQRSLHKIANTATVPSSGASG